MNTINTSLQGIQRGLQNLNQAAQNIASAGVQRGQEVETFADSAVKAKQAELQVKSSVAVLKAEDEAVGTLLDIRA